MGLLIINILIEIFIFLSSTEKRYWKVWIFEASSNVASNYFSVSSSRLQMNQYKDAYLEPAKTKRNTTPMKFDN